MLDGISLLFLQVLIVVGLPLILWGVLGLGRFLPLPIIQIFVGIALGPSLFGWLWPEGSKLLFASREAVSTLGNIAVVLFVFLAGCEVDRAMIRASRGMVLSVGIAGVMLPALLGVGAALGLLHLFPAAGLVGAVGSPALYAAAFGICMAVTALPILMIILRELGFNQRPIGAVALAVGGIDDAFLWISLAVLLPLAHAGGLTLDVLWALAGAAVLILVLSRFVSPALARLAEAGASERLVMSLVILVLFTGALLTQLVHLHAVLGAFIVGLLLPEKLRHLAPGKLEVPVHLLLLPFLFLQTGLETEFSFSDPVIWTVLGVAFLTCVGGKFIGVSVPARLAGQSLAFSVTLGVLMQCKGLMEIVVVKVLRDEGVLGETTFSALVLLALLSTALTAPLARLCERTFGPAASDTARHAPVKVEAEPAPARPSAAAAGASASLVFEDGHAPVPLAKPEVVIGRSRDADVRVDDLRVSRQHARLKALPGGRYAIENLTADRAEPVEMLVNGASTAAAEIGDGDEVRLNGVGFRLKVAPAAAA